MYILGGLDVRWLKQKIIYGVESRDLYIQAHRKIILG